MNVKETLERGGLKVTEFAKILGVNRVTVSTWVNGRWNPHHLLMAKVAAMLQTVEWAVQDGTLPVPDDRSVSRADRIKMLKSVLLKARKARQ